MTLPIYRPPIYVAPAAPHIAPSCGEMTGWEILSSDWAILLPAWVVVTVVLFFLFRRQ